MPRPPRRTAGARRGEKKDISKPVRVDSPAPPSSPPVLRRTRGAGIAKPITVLSRTSTATSDLETVPSTLPLTNSNNDSSVPESSAAVLRVSESTIARANEAISTIARNNISQIEVEKTPSPNAVIRVADVLSACTPSPIETRGKKRDSKTAFEEDFAASLIAAEEDDENDATPDTPTRTGSGPRKRHQSFERILDDGRECPILNLTGKSTLEKGKRIANPNDTIDFNYSSSPERSPGALRFGLLKPLEDSSDSDSSGSESDDEEEPNENENHMEEAVAPAPSRPRRTGPALAAAKDTKQPDAKHISTKSLQSLLPKRRAKPTTTKSKTSKLKPRPKTQPKEKASAKPRRALGDVTKDILDEDELQAIDAPPRPLFGAGMDILSDDELGREIYIDSSARASTYGKPRRQDSEVSNKENDTPAARSSGRLMAASSKLADAANVDLNKTEKKEVDTIRRKFKEVDRWDLCFEDVIPSSSDGVVAGAR
ncbi:hypothetical protein ABW21_db0201162 [Orbilia brochopaga]|nr:hypothetical protein ABW21_db0201162 [Drechslerella brochopaga]